MSNGLFCSFTVGINESRSQTQSTHHHQYAQTRITTNILIQEGIVGSSNIICISPEFLFYEYGPATAKYPPSVEASLSNHWDHGQKKTGTKHLRAIEGQIDKKDKEHSE